MLKGTYVTPHRYRDPPKAESFLVLSGELAFFTFEDSGQVSGVHVLGHDPIGIDIQPGVWHTLAVLSTHAICFEVRPGPYSVMNEKDFATWAPREGEPNASEYVASLISLVRRP